MLYFYILTLLTWCSFKWTRQTNMGKSAGELSHLVSVWFEVRSRCVNTLASLLPLACVAPLAASRQEKLPLIWNVAKISAAERCRLYRALTRRHHSYVRGYYFRIPGPAVCWCAPGSTSWDQLCSLLTGRSLEKTQSRCRTTSARKTETIVKNHQTKYGESTEWCRLRSSCEKSQF